MHPHPLPADPYGDALSPSEVNNTPEKAMKTAREGIGLFMDEIEITLASNPDKDQHWPGRIRV